MIAQKCNFCERVDFANSGARNLHMRNCELKSLRAERDANKSSNVDPGSGKKHEHEWRLLRSSVKLERVAISQGYSKVCATCEELGGE